MARPKALRRKILLAIGALLSFGTLAACSPHQIAVFNSLSPEGQTAVLQELQRQQGGGGSGGDCYSAIEQVWPGHLQAKARTIVSRESGNNPSAQNRSSSAAGCWQILTGSWIDPGGCPRSTRYDAVCNTRAALALYNSAGGWSPWRLTAY
jgi:hypothetical protein